MPTMTTRQGCSFAANIFLACSMDIRVTLMEKLTLINAASVCTGTEVALGDDEVLPEEDRQAKYDELVGIVTNQLNPIVANHEDFTPEELYNGVDMLYNVAGAILDGETTVTGG